MPKQVATASIGVEGATGMGRATLMMALASALQVSFAVEVGLFCGGSRSLLRWK
jgi:hypothetical protein